jgi:hypothetical protein
MLGEENMPTKILDKNNKYSYKVTATAIRYANKDKLK